MKRSKVVGFAIILSIMALTFPLTATAENSAIHYLTSMYDGSTVNTGKDNGFKGTTQIKNGDVHYAWSLGQFVLTGYTEVVKEESVPVFLVNPGDTISLTYKLDQNIDALNGKDSLFISEDTNGYDEAFQVEKTNFGRGALLVKFTDSTNKTRVTPHLDYLTSVKGRTANATISNLEEGDYEVALDYEIAENMWPGHKYYNYRTVFKFKVRNSSSMVFLRDLKTKDQIANFSVAENGFSVEKSSHYQKVSVGRQNLTDNGNGYSLTQITKRECYDGAEFTDPGIYTVSVKNNYTGESVDMTIAVGDDRITNAYVTSNCVYKPEEISEMVANGAARITDDWRIEVVNKPQSTEEPDTPVVAPVEPPKTTYTINVSAETIIAVACVVFVIVVGAIIAVVRNRKKTKQFSEEQMHVESTRDDSAEEE